MWQRPFLAKDFQKQVHREGLQSDLKQQVALVQVWQFGWSLEGAKSQYRGIQHTAYVLGAHSHREGRDEKPGWVGGGASLGAAVGMQGQ